MRKDSGFSDVASGFPDAGSLEPNQIPELALRPATPQTSNSIKEHP